MCIVTITHILKPPRVTFSYKMLYIQMCPDEQMHKLHLYNACTHCIVHCYCLATLGFGDYNNCRLCLIRVYNDCRSLLFEMEQLSFEHGHRVGQPSY